MPHEFHEFSTMFPLLEGEDFNELVADIKAHDQREIIVMLDDKVLDGRNRYRACMELGIKPRLRDFNCNDGDPIDFVLSANLKRRHLNPKQRGYAVVAANKLRGRGLESGSTKAPNGGFHKPQVANGRISTAEAAKLADTSEKLIERTKYVVNHGNKKDIEKLKDKDSKLFTVYTDVQSRTSYRGPQITTPENLTLEEWVRKGLELEETGMSADAASKEINCPVRTYRMIREMVLLSDRDDLSTTEEKIVKASLKELNETKKLFPYELIKPISQRIWGKGGIKNDKTELRRKENFEHAIGTIYYSTTAKLEIPQLSKEETNDIIRDLKEAIDNIKQIIKTVEEIYLNG